MSQIKGANILITGAAHGIGRKLVQILAHEGACVLAWDIDRAALQSMAGEIAKTDGQIQTYVCDLADRAQIYATAERVLEEFEGVDILINNAGIVSGKPFLECADEAIERTMQVNIMAHFWLAKAFLPGMKQRKRGHIVTIASAGGLIGTPRLADYSASKFAAVGFDEALRGEFKKEKLKLKTTVVCPFYINTGMFDGVKTRFPRLLPILDENRVARRVVNAIKKDCPRLWMPWMVYTVPPMRILPVWLFDAIASFFGVNSSMDEFKGRTNG